MSGDPLPAGWSGRSFACHQGGVRAATGDYLLFTDADTLHSPESVAHAVRAIRTQRADFLSASVRQTLGSIGVLVVVPTKYVMTALLLPLGLIPRENSRLVAFAAGQFMICRAQALRSIGGDPRHGGRDEVFHDAGERFASGELRAICRARLMAAPEGAKKISQ